MPTALAWLFTGLLKLIIWTYSVRIHDEEHFLENTDPSSPSYVLTLWHNRLLTLPVLMPLHIRKRVSALISSSRDGEYIASIMKCLRVTPVRGSSSRGGARALLELLAVLRSGMHTALTLDGPRGPRYIVHPGVVMLGQKYHIPILPLSINAKHKWCFRSWDKMQLPVPFSTIDFVVGKPFYLPDDCDNVKGCAIVREALLSITED